ncbi:MAG TPA: glucose-6-phosphate dehydrogenase [Acidimicrobiales bacterium]|nr:glucose-6-phosphate dehydrogenase [Acidimicrobiales bacterium]
MTRQAPPAAFVIMGASGDLTTRKLLPALARLHAGGLLPHGFAIVGTARSEMNDEQFRQLLHDAAPKGGAGWRDVISRSRYVAGEYHSPLTYINLGEVLREVDNACATGGNRIFYLATPPAVFGTIVERLGGAAMNKPSEHGSFVRVVIEKPYGRDLKTATELDHTVHTAFDESSVYRIDHYLGKETVQNVLALRFANAIFEPIWNRRYIDNVQITVAETLGIGHRGSFYETAGALRDIVQNHVLQVLTLVAMEPPARIQPEEIRDEKVKVLRAIDIMSSDEVNDYTVRGQYGPGEVLGERVEGYCDEEDVAPDSHTETYVAARFMVDNWRWNGVPFFVRTGKRLRAHTTEIAMEFKDVPHLPFKAMDATGLGSNVLVVRVQPDDGITLRFGAKVPGQDFRVRTVDMDFTYADAFTEESPDAYERLLLDALVGDPTLFIREDEVRNAWKICDPILDAWAEGRSPLAHYRAGTWGPKEADRLLAHEGRAWHEPCCGS